MGSVELSAWDSWCPSQLGIVLLGGRNSGKSSVGNLILGKDEFVAPERTSCSRRLGVVAGRWLTVVDTPGWWCDFPARDTSELVKREIISSVSLCSPGPHVFLITVKASSAFSERRRRAVEEHVALLGDRVWSRCVVVFTSADGAKRTQAGCGGKALRWLCEKCDRRCHSVISGDETEAAELLMKIQKVVTENGNGVFEMQGGISQVYTDDKRGAEERAQQRYMKVKKLRAVMRERSRPMTNIRIVLLGATGSGKTSALNTILGRESGQRPGRTAQCLAGEGVVFGRRLTVVDTPGWWMNYSCGDSPVFDLREMLLSLSLCPPGPHVFLLVIRVDRAFAETHRRAAQEHLEMIGEHIWGGVVLLFSFGDWLGAATPEQHIESEGEPLRWLVERCSNRYHVLNNKSKGDRFQVRDLIGKIEEMAAGGDGSRHYQIERSVMEQLEGKMRRDKERSKERLMKKEKQRQMARSQLGKVDLFPELRIALIGGRKTGKSSCGNTILSRKCFDAERQTTSCCEKKVVVRGKAVTVLDTPGLFSVTSDLLTAPPPCAILLVVDASSSFRDGHMEALEKQLESGGGLAWSRAVVLFSHGDWLGDTSIEQRIEGEGEPLQRLVERCGNRYHVLDNTHRGDGAQVDELMELIEEMLAEGRLDIFPRDDHAGRRVSAPEQQAETVTLCKKDLKVLMSYRHQTPRDWTESTTSTSCPPLNSEVEREGGRIVALPAGRAGRASMDRDNLMSCLASLLSAKQTLGWTATGQQAATVNLPLWFLSDDPHSQFTLNAESQVSPFSPRHPTVVWILPQMEENPVNMHPLCHPALRERTLRRLTDCGGLQALIDQWGDSSLEELEAFIDSYFETVWEQSMGSLQPPEQNRPAEQEAAAGEAEEEVLSSIDRKLSKLDLLEEIRRDLAELRKSLERSWKAIRELRQESKRDGNTC